MESHSCRTLGRRRRTGGVDAPPARRFSRVPLWHPHCEMGLASMVIRSAAHRVLVLLLALALAVPLPLMAQQAPAPALFRPEQLEQIAAPVALYPDPLLAQVLMAATYPLEVVLADRFVQAHPDLKGDALSQALQERNWDDSVKSLATFPQILRMMSERLEWMQQLGDAFMSQEAELMDAVQRLRARAFAQGTLRSTEQQTITIEGSPPQQVIAIQPASPQVVYVPMYSPAVVYGPWPYPEYPPYYYYPPGWPAAAFFTFGVGILVGWSLWGIVDWHHHHVDVHRDHYRDFTHRVNHEDRRGGIEHGRPGPRDGDRFSWEHDPRHRRGVDYRDAATRQRFGRVPSPDAPAREPFRGRGAPGQPERGRPAGPAPERRAAPEPRPGPGERPATGQRPAPGAPPRAEQQPSPERRPAPEHRGAPEGRAAPAPRPAPERPSGPAPQRPGPETRAAPGLSPGTQPRGEPEIFRGLGAGGAVQGYSERGRDSRQRSAPQIRSAPSPPRSPAPQQSGPRGGTRGGGSPGKGTK